MENPIGKVKYYGKIALATLLGTGLFASPVSGSCPKDDSEKKIEEPIYSTSEEFTVAGGGDLLVRDVHPLYLNNDKPTDLSTHLTTFYTKMGQFVPISAMDAKEGLENILKFLGPDSCLTGKEIARKNRIKYLLDSVVVEKSDSITTYLLNKAVQDNCLDPIADSLYVNGKWNIKEGPQMLIGKTSKNPQSVPMLVYLRLEELAKRYEKDAQEYRKRLEEKDISKIAISKEGKKGINNRIHGQRYKKFYKENEKKKNRAIFQAGANFGTDDEINAYASLGFPLGNSFYLGPYGEVIFKKDNKSSADTTVTTRAVELIGPGTYKDRTDEITTQEVCEDIAVAGLRIEKMLGNFGVYVAGGVLFSNETIQVSGKATITHTRNGIELDRNVITNTLPREENHNTEAIGEIGLEYNLNPVVLGFSANYHGEWGAQGGIGIRF